MDDFTAKPGAPNLFGLAQGVSDAIAPGKRPLSSMAPSLVEKDGHVVLVLGSPGGARIITTVLETLINIIDYDMPPAQAVAAPRLHYQGQPDKLFYEHGGLPPETIAALVESGYTLAPQSLGCGRVDRGQQRPVVRRQRQPPSRRRRNRLLTAFAFRLEQLSTAQPFTESRRSGFCRARPLRASADFD